MTLEQYQMTDVLCDNILAEFNPKTDTLAWLEKYKGLFNRINIQPGNLPAIADCNFEGVKYDKIAKFHSLYSKTKYEYSLLGHMPHTEE